MFIRADNPRLWRAFRLLAVAVMLLGAAGFDSAHAAVGKARPKKTADRLPVRGIHLRAPAKTDLQTALDFIRDVLPKEGVNTLILEFNYEFDYQSRPEFANPRALNKADVEQLAAACRARNIELIPQINCLGHQSSSRTTGKLLRLHPEFDETPGKYPENKDIYCRSYCPLHPDVHEVLFDLMDELAAACNAKSFHVGMDEVFILADPDCPRCKGRNPADLFAGEVERLRDHLRSRGCRMWMWGDRFLDAKTTGLGRWEAADNGTAPAVDRVPKDIVICDWHYEKAPDTPRYFAEKGFDVVACPWRKSNVALDQLAHIRAIRGGADKAVASRALGMVQTTWCGFGAFVQAYQAQTGSPTPVKNNAAEAAQCFRTLFAAIRQPNPK